MKTEFENKHSDRASLMVHWQEEWQCLFAALESANHFHRENEKAYGMENPVDRPKPVGRL